MEGFKIIGCFLFTVQLKGWLNETTFWALQIKVLCESQLSKGLFYFRTSLVNVWTCRLLKERLNVEFKGPAGPLHTFRCSGLGAATTDIPTVNFRYHCTSRCVRRNHVRRYSSLLYRIYSLMCVCISAYISESTWTRRKARHPPADPV